MSGYAAELLEFVGSPLWPLLDDESVEDLAIQQPGEIWLCRRGRWTREDAPLTVEDIKEMPDLAGSLNKHEVNERTPICDTELPTGGRLNICVPPVTKECPALTFRKLGTAVSPLSSMKDRYRTEGWNKWRRLDGGRDWTDLLEIYDRGDMEEMLAASVRAKLNILQVGKTGDGKTTLSATTATAIDNGERLITIEDVIELLLMQPNIVRLISSVDEGGVDTATLLRTTLRMRASRVLLQEVRDGAAAWTLFSGVVGPHPGVITTIHGHDAISGLSRLAMLLRSAPEARGMTADDIGALLNNSIDLVIPLHLGEDGVRDFFPVWFAGDAHRRGETAADLLRT